MELFEIGRIVKASGLKGRMKAVSFLESNDILQSLDEIFLKRGTEEAKPLKLKDIQVRGKTFFLEIEGAEDGESARKFVGCQVLIPAGRLERLPEGEYYWRDIIGLEVVTEDGRVLGKIESIFPTGSNDVYVCAGGDREILIPGIADVIRKIDTDRGMMIIELIEGL